MLSPITNTDVERLTSDIWTSMLNLDIQPGTISSPTATKISACVQILGKWEGAVRLDLSFELARKAAAAFVGVEPEDVSHDQVLDTAGELANMTAGGLKVLLPKPCRLSMPSVIEGRDFAHSMRRGNVVVDSSFSTEGGSLMVTVFESNVQGA